MEVIEGAPPAEYGDKTSLVIVVTTRSGLGVTQPHGEITTSFGSFGTVNGGVNLAYGGKNWGNFISAERAGYQPVSGRPGAHGDARSRQSAEHFRPAGFEAFLERHDQPEFRLYAKLVPDAEFVRLPERDGLVGTGCVNY